MGVVYCLIFCVVVGVVCLICFKSEKLNSPEFRAPTIVEVKLLTGGSSVFRFGVVAQQLQKFAIKYSDGHVEIKEVHPDTLEYKKLMKYIKWEDIQ